jgi:hypothetical protein
MSSPDGRPPKRRTKGSAWPHLRTACPRVITWVQGPLASRSGLVFAVCGPWTHVRRLRPGHTEMRTHQPPFYRANALSASCSVAGLAFPLGGADRRAFLPLPTGVGFSLVGADRGLVGLRVRCPGSFAFGAPIWWAIVPDRQLALGSSRALTGVLPVGRQLALGSSRALTGVLPVGRQLALGFARGRSAAVSSIYLPGAGPVRGADRALRGSLEPAFSVPGVLSRSRALIGELSLWLPTRVGSSRGADRCPFPPGANGRWVCTWALIGGASF